ncbi:multiple sugar transport system substrate-binding protein [Hoeflea marina]|uniref:Multiple sugar transport system substrate-binding protein n=1 Tax=Hoeflea marina TaxID=274592 RepID=A0A317PE45_9HYPH|nr:extracellular solute-binding protein [Hoeflea marina]PWV95801.1 multiple sugar transport system substrate-binding protein [Hoeflea marina]
MEFRGKLSRRTFLRNSTATGIAIAGTTWGTPLLAASNLPDPQSVLDDISISKYVRKDYQKLYGMSDDKPIWDNSKDWIRTVDWEAVRSELSGTTVRFAVGAADAESAAEGLVPFEKLSGIKVELVPIPDDSFYDKALAEFISGNASFDALQFFSPWLGDFAAPGFLHELDGFADKWKLPLDDFYDTYRMNYGFFNGKMYGIPFDCDVQMVHVRKGYMEKLLGGEVDRVNSIPTYDELIRVSRELNKVEPGVSGIGLMAAPGFWSTYTWEHVSAQAGMMLFNENWEPIFNGDAGMKGLEIILELSKNANEGFAGAGWPENRAAWLGGQVATNISWQDSGTQAMRPDQSQIVDDFVTIYEPRIAGGRFAPPNIAGSTSCVAASAQNAEGAFLMLAFLTTGSIMAMNEANANGVAPGYKSVLQNPNLQAVSQPAKVWADSLEHAWCSPRLPGAFPIEQAIGNEINRAVVGQITAKEALDNAATAVKAIMASNGFYQGKDPVDYAEAAPGLYVGEGKALPF